MLTIIFILKGALIAAQITLIIEAIKHCIYLKRVYK
tara:strand:+ start:618 stop:725 length:108 start_codon:yes stop_codon:yes gene_type:complete